MAHTYLVVVDMQRDFIDGALGTPEAQSIVEAVIQKVQDFSDTVVFTQDTHTSHYLTTQEGKRLPIPHCIKDTPGWQLEERLATLCRKRSATIYKKESFGSLDLAHDLVCEHASNPIERIELVGLCTDICVVSNALLLKAFMPEVPLAVDARCCAGTTPQAHESALQTMESCHIDIIGS